MISLDRAQAVPAFPDDVTATQPDGSVFALRLLGDEFFSWHETGDGYAIVRDPADGFWKYARPATDRAEFLAIPDARVGAADPARLGIQPHAMPSARLLRERIEPKLHSTMGDPVELPIPGAVPGPIPGAAAEESPPAMIPVSGTKAVKNIVLLACFSNHWDTVNGTVLAAQGRVNISEYSNLFNQVSHTTDGAVGSVRDYYKEVSYGKLTIQSIVAPWVRLSTNEAYYGSTNTTSSDINPRAMVAEAITAADAAGFDFSQGDSDGDGWVDCLTVIHSGHGQEYTGNPSTCIWSHKWTMASVLTKDGVKMYTYHTEPALRDSTASTSIIRIGVICHEMGHFFGLPDLYDYSGGTYGIGKWGIMANGSWNGTDGKRPAHFCAWSKCMLGFVNPVPIHSQAGLSLARVEDNPVVKLMRDGTSNGEYFLFENRSRTGFDNDSTIHPGMVIYHIDSKSANNDTNTWPHQAVKIEEGDGDNSLGAKTASSEPGDVWCSTNGLSGGFRDQTGVQSANAMRYQTHLYNRPDNSTYYTYNRLSGFSLPGSNMTCNVTTLKTGVGSQALTAATYSVSWTASSDATKYELQEGAPATLTSLTDGAEDEDAVYDNWFLSGTVKRDSDARRSGSYSFAMHQYYSNKWYSSVQAMTMRKPFVARTNTAVSFYFLSHLGSGNGDLKCQISNDSGDTWRTLGSYSGYIDPWSLRTYRFTNMTAQGINTNDACILRFVANTEYTSGWSNFPGYGFALDDISITNTAMSGHGDWTTLNSNITTTSYSITNRPAGVFAYRVRAFANGAWQGYGPEGETAMGPLSTDLAVAKSGSPGTVTAGEPLTYVISVTNRGPNFASSVTVTDTLPASVSFVSASTGGSYTNFGNTVIFSLGNLASNAVASMSLIVTPAASGTITNNASAGSAGGDPAQANNSALAFNVVPVDADADGMDDTWEFTHDLDPTDPNDANLDRDGDGMSNLHEYIAGTDPCDCSSRFFINSVAIATGQATLRFQAHADITYQVEYSTNLVHWSPLPNGLVSGVEGSATVTDPNAGTNPRRFYRACVQP